MQAFKMKLLIGSVLTVVSLTGCASVHNDKRELNQRLASTCSTQQKNYLASTKEDLAFVFMPILSLGGTDSCKKFVTGNCNILNDTWLFYAPFALIDTPFAVIRDIYEIPSDIRHSQTLQQCADSARAEELVNN